MQASPKVSVIIPNYNHARYLVQRIDSVLNQTFQDFELIILDDKSTDNSKEIIERYRTHPKVSAIVYNEINSGTTFKQWNKGIKLAKGELVWLAESDDAASVFFLEELVSRFNEYPTLGIAYCDSFNIDEQGKQTKRTHEWKNERFSSARWSNDYFNTGINEVNQFLIYHTVIDNVSSALFKKEILFKAGLADESFRYAGDTFFYLKILSLSDVAYSCKPLNYFREHLTNTSKEAFRNGLRPLEELLAFSKMLNYSNKISKEAKEKRLSQSVSNYKYFAGITLKTNKNLPAFLEGNIRLFKANTGYFCKVLVHYVKGAITNT